MLHIVSLISKSNKGVYSPKKNCKVICCPLQGEISRANQFKNMIAGCLCPLQRMSANRKDKANLN